MLKIDRAKVANLQAKASVLQTKAKTALSPIHKQTKTFLGEKTTTFSPKLWPPNEIENAKQRKKATFIYSIILAFCLIWTCSQYLVGGISSFMAKPTFESTIMIEPMKYPVVTLCGSGFMKRDHLFSRNNYGCEFFDHSNPEKPLSCSAKVIDRPLYWDSKLVDVYDPPCIIFNQDADTLSSRGNGAAIDLAVWAYGSFNDSVSDDDLWKDLKSYSVFLSEFDLDDPKAKRQNYFAMNTMTTGYAEYRVKKKVVDDDALFSTQLLSQIPGDDDHSVELLFDTDKNGVQYLRKKKHLANIYLLIGSMGGILTIATTLYRVIVATAILKKPKIQDVNQDSMDDERFDEQNSDGSPESINVHNKTYVRDGELSRDDISLEDDGSKEDATSYEREAVEIHSSNTSEATSSQSASFEKGRNLQK
uniref:Uncharacterized protein n=1 Tax=Chaetoceros debilis TaxID=122233 RepID=A0A7S3PYT4_9STRA|mmetsp:Transcript_14020/g.20948  ORF Transcript_14020/g.20948 Transcript_14020/m.20948 type:complete len:419 (-) Transcript_14020:325-1581(-)